MSKTLTVPQASAPSVKIYSSDQEKMRWKRNGPKHADRRIVKRFAFLPVEYYFSSVCVYEDDEEFLFVEVNYCPRCGQKVEGVSSQTSD